MSCGIWKRQNASICHCGAPYHSESEPNTTRSGPMYLRSCPSMCAHTLGNVITQEAKLVPISAYAFQGGVESCATSLCERRSGAPRGSWSLRTDSNASELKKHGTKK